MYPLCLLLGSLLKRNKLYSPLGTISSQRGILIKISDRDDKEFAGFIMKDGLNELQLKNNNYSITDGLTFVDLKSPERICNNDVLRCVQKDPSLLRFVKVPTDDIYAGAIFINPKCIDYVINNLIKKEFQTWVDYLIAK